jgi:XrtJ-associated TM-motif-TM protein
MNKQVMRLSVFFGLALLAGNVLAQESGCVDSPENPTVVLGLLGGAAASVSWLRAKLGARRSKHALEAALEAE